jgi:GNAT superfamily N-acetyltransferase
MSEPPSHSPRPHGLTGAEPPQSRGFTLSAAAVAAASAAWVWVPDNATVVEGEEYAILRLPDYFDYQLSLLTFTPAGPLGAAVDAVLARARSFELPELQWQVRLGDPAELATELVSRGATRRLTLDVLASDLADGVPPLPPPSVDVTIRWATDFETARDGSAVSVTGFGGTLPPDERIEANAARDAATVPAGEGGLLVAYANGRPLGAGGVSLVDGIARLWGGVVVPSARGQGLYRAVLEARLAYAVRHGATMALVKGNVATSGPILRKAGFAAFGQEPLYRVPLH